MQEDALASVPQQIVKLELDDPPTEEEVEKAITKLKHGKASGIDGLPAKVFMVGGDATTGQLSCLFALC